MIGMMMALMTEGMMTLGAVAVGAAVGAVVGAMAALGETDDEDQGW